MKASLKQALSIGLMATIMLPVGLPVWAQSKETVEKKETGIWMAKVSPYGIVSAIQQEK